jgi:hypothetical protein
VRQSLEQHRTVVLAAGLYLNVRPVARIRSVSRSARLDGCALSLKTEAGLSLERGRDSNVRNDLLHANIVAWLQRRSWRPVKIDLVLEEQPQDTNR